MQGRGGSRKHPADCKCGKCPKLGRPKADRPVDGNVARKIKAKVKAEETWVALIETEKFRLRLDLPVKERPVNVPTTPLSNMLRYQDDRDLGRPMDTVNHLHDKPLEVNATLTLGEGMRIAMEKAEQRVRSRK
jgi:hypothetical protein